MKPTWITQKGLLGRIAELKFFRIPLYADNTEKFVLIAGRMPNGIRVTEEGILQGIPNAVDVDTDYHFTVRAYSETNEICDRSFYITVIGEDVPVFKNENLLGEFAIHSCVFIPIIVENDDPSDTLEWNIISGELPDGLVLENGTITGRVASTNQLTNKREYNFTIEVNDNKHIVRKSFALLIYDTLNSTADNGVITTDDTFIKSDSYDQLLPFMIDYCNSLKSYYPPPDYIEITGFDIPHYDVYQYSVGNEIPFVIPELQPWDTHNYETYGFDSGYVNNYEFKGWEDFIYDSHLWDSNQEDISISSYQINPNAVFLGRYYHKNFFAYHLKGYNPDSIGVEFFIKDGHLPPGITLDMNTGWLYGHFGDYGYGEANYQFTVQIRRKDDYSYAQDYMFYITIYGESDKLFHWITDEDLGVMYNGDISVLYVTATHDIYQDLYYRLYSGKLPNGMKLLPSGNISGRASFNTFVLDSDNTTIFDNDTTTFDGRYNFTVECYNNEIGSISRKTFTLFIKRKYNSPTESLKFIAYSPVDDRKPIKDLLNDKSIFEPELIYRQDDPWYGISKGVSYTHAYSLKPSFLGEYADMVEKNHHKKKLILGEIKTAQALDDYFRPLYEVVYAEIVDDQANSKKQSASKEIELRFPVSKFYFSGDTVKEYNTQMIYPNSLDNMRRQVYDHISLESYALPRWMLSKQKDGKILGFTAAWVIAYVKPGYGDALVYRLKEKLGSSLNEIDFTIDRYIVERSASKLWDYHSEYWSRPAEMVTFDRSGDIDNETYFDNGSMRFVSPVDKYEITDEYDKFILFPKTNVFT